MDMHTDEFYQPTPKEQQVWQVCDSLYAEKKRITYASIGNKLISLGLKRGSNSDLCRYLASWKKHRYPTIHTTKELNAPDKAKPKDNNVYSTSNIQATLSKFEERLDNLTFEQKRFTKILQKQMPSSSEAKEHIVPLLIDIIQKQQSRESHYLKALEHAREIQRLLKLELERGRLHESTDV